MVIKLVRVDIISPCKVKLITGEHLIGRGALLSCDDKRISRQHGQLIVTDDSLTVKALHQNPCFYTRKDSKETNILQLGNTISLNNGDRFGLLPDTFWFEVMFCLDNDNEVPDASDMEQNTEDYLKDDVNKENTNGNTVAGESNSQSIINSDCNGTVDNFERLDPPTETVQQVPAKEQIQNNGEASKSIDTEPGEELNQSAEEPTKEPEQRTPKRSHSPDNSEIKKARTEPVKVKTEPVDDRKEPVDDKTEPVDDKTEPVDSKTQAPDVKTEPQNVKNEPGDVKPGPSVNQADPAAPADAAKDNLPKAANKPLRERCMYGANCYRRNPQHRQQFSHPQDADWGPGERGVCPYGAGCARADPRHWRDHTHPPGTMPPIRPGMQVVERHGNMFFINAHTVNFYDDHFQVEDSEGDSVDYDYEF